MILHHAILKADFASARRLIEMGAGVNERDHDGRTPLMICSLHNGEAWALGVARMLLAHGGKVGLRDVRGRSALTYAVLYGRQALVQLLLQALDFNPGEPDNAGRNALWHASHVGNRDIHDLLFSVFVKYDCGKGPKNVPFVPAGERLQQSCFSGSKSRSKPVKSQESPSLDVLPYKTLPSNLWEKRQAAYRPLASWEDLSSRTFSEKAAADMKVEEALCAVAPSKAKLGWRLTMKNLTEKLQVQLSPSYRPQAKPRPPPPRACRRRLSGRGADSSLQAKPRQRRPRGRKMSLGSIDDGVRREVQESPRRCSIAAIPMIRPAPGTHPSVTIYEGFRLGEKGKASSNRLEKLKTRNEARCNGK